MKKKILLVMFLIFNDSLFSQNKLPTDFLGIRWGANKTTVITKLTEIISVKLLENNDSLLTFFGGEFASREVLQWKFDFFNDQLYSVTLFLSVDAPIYLDDIYSKLVNDIIDKYGKPEVINNEIKENTRIWMFSKNLDGFPKYIIETSKYLDNFISIVLHYADTQIYFSKQKHNEKVRKKSLEEL